MLCECLREDEDAEEMKILYFVVLSCSFGKLPCFHFEVSASKTKFPHVVGLIYTPTNWKFTPQRKFTTLRILEVS